jgi:serine/threonine protein kinase
MESKQVVVLPRERPPSMIVGMGTSASLIPIGARSFGKYELLARLATGGMAEIFLARRRDATPPDNSVLVIKRVLPHLAEDARFVSMFRDEARLAARIEHDNVCRVLDMGSVGDTYFIAMEYLHGMPLSRVLVRAARTEQPLDIRLVAGCLVQCCAGLHHAHELKDADGRSLDVVHRDISPPNIFVTESGVVKLLDFGVAKAHGASEKTRTGTVKGKNAYMSPEQVLGQAMDRRSDIFSLGIVLWEALTAQRLFMREVDFETFRAITEGEVPDVRLLRPDTPPELVEVVLKALSLRPEQRYATALDLGDAVAAAVVGIGAPASEREIAAFIKERFASELTARVQLLDATGASVDGVEVGRRKASPTGDPGEADTVVGDPARPGQQAESRKSVEIRWSQSRKSHAMPRITTASIPRLDAQAPASPGPALGTRPITQPIARLEPAPRSAPISAAGELRVRPSADPRLRTQRVKALPPPPRPGEPAVPDEDPGHEAAAVVFIAGVFSLLVVLWWLL